MATFFARNKIICAALAAGTLAGAAVVPEPAQADRWRRHHHHHGGNGGAVAAGVGLGVLGLALGAAAASEAERADRCWVERRRVVNRYGEVRLRDVEVCD